MSVLPRSAVLYSKILRQKLSCCRCFLLRTSGEKIQKVVMEHVHITYDENPQPGAPAMLDGIEPCTKVGIFADNIEELIMHDVKVEGQEGEAFILRNIENMISDPQ